MQRVCLDDRPDVFFNLFAHCGSSAQQNRLSSDDSPPSRVVLRYREQVDELCLPAESRGQVLQVFVARNRVPGVFAIVLAIQQRRSGKAGRIS